LLRVKLPDLDSDNSQRRAIAQRYTQGLAGLPLAVPSVSEWAEPVWHLYVVRSGVRDQLQRHLEGLGIQTMVHYPVPPHMQKAYASMRGFDLPIAEAIHREVLSLPLWPGMQLEQVDRVIAGVRHAVGE
jgi:dTDP-4-amino-4,6-dideoxygalactose transaminase